MTITMIHSKIHRATITDANLNYVGSITIDSALLEAAGMLVGQKVDIVNVNNGERFSTYIISGVAGSGDICVNGAAARKVHVGDKIIIIAYAQMEHKEAMEYKPKLVILEEDKNEIAQLLEGLE